MNLESSFATRWLWMMALGLGTACFPPALPREVDGDDTSTDTLDTSPPDVPDGEIEQPSRPANVVASTHRADSIELHWAAVAGASGYRVERCATPCEAGWATLESVEGTSYVDEAVTVPSLPAPPGGVTAATSLPTHVEVTWSAVTAPLAQRYRYRVIAVGLHGESAPSDVAEGAVAERPVTGYEVLVADAWSGVTTTSWSDDGAPPPSVTPGTAVASQATSPTHVALTVSGATASPGEPRSYAVRAVTAYGWSQPSATVSGHRRAGTLTYQWERSAGSSAEDFAPIAGGTATTHNDTDAPADGSTRWYRVIVSADGAEPATSAAVAGARLGSPDVPGAVQASADLVDRVEVSWQAVAGAIGYHVYRDGVKLTTGNGVAVTTYSDLGAPAPTEAWGAPTTLVATTNQHDKVVVSWTAPPRPQGAIASYTVTAVNPAGEGPPSTAASGRRVAVALVGYDVEVTPSGGNATWIATGTTETSWDHMTAPAGVITPGTITATQGTRRAFVALTSSGASVSQPVSVTYRVRGALANSTTTAASGTATGRRTVGSLVRSWESAVPNVDPDFDDFGVNATSFNDTTAPSNGAARLYRLALTATGAQPVYTPTVQGARLAFWKVAVGGRHTCAISRTNEIWCWGANEYGQLGRGTISTHGEAAKVVLPPETIWPMDLVAGGNHTCFVDDDMQVYCWGQNTAGQLGDGTWTSRSVPTRVPSFHALEPWAMGAGTAHTCAIDNNWTVKCWGDNERGQIGLQPREGIFVSPTHPDLPSNAEQDGSLVIVASATGTCVETARSSDWYCWGVGAHTVDPMGTNEEAVYSASRLSDTVALGDDHGCLFQTVGPPRCWSYWNTFGQVGNGSWDSPAEYDTPTLVIGLTSVTALETIANTTFAVQSGVIYAWGDGALGQIGDGASIANRKVPVPIIGPTFTAPWQLAKGSPVANHMCALVDYAPRCWGANGSRQLGTSDTSTRYAPVAVTLP